MAHPAISPSPAADLRLRNAWMDDASSREPLHAAGSVMHFPEGREIFAEGGDSDMFFKVVSGMVRTCKFRSDGRRQIEAFHGEGDVFGFETGHERRLSAEAVGECTLVAYRRTSVEALAQKDMSVGRQLFRYAMRGMTRAQEHTLLLGRRGAAEKVAAFLIRLAAQSPDHHAITLKMSRQDIGDYLGLTIETVSRTFSQLERDGVIELPNARQVCVRNPEALEDLAA
jgi:CRP/FNR family transcriptional regulator, nitrogen fixation regulation protein